MAQHDMSGSTSEAPAFQREASRDIQPRHTAAQKGKFKRSCLRGGIVPGRTPSSALSFAVRQAPMTPSLRRAKTLDTCCSFCRGCDSSTPTNVNGSSSSSRVQSCSVVPGSCVGTSDDEGANKSQAVAVCCFFCHQRARRGLSCRSLTTQNKEKCILFHGGEVEVSGQPGTEPAVFAEAFPKECWSFCGGRSGYGDFVESTDRAHDRFSFSSLWHCCSGGVRGTGDLRRGFRIPSMRSRSEKHKEVHFLVRFARRNMWDFLDRIPALAANKRNTYECLAPSTGVESKNTSVEQRDAFAWSAAALHIRQQNKSDTQEQHSSLRAFQEFISSVREREVGGRGNDCKQRQSPPTFRVEEDAFRSRQDASRSAAEGHVLNICSKLTTAFAAAGGGKTGVNDTFAEALRAASAAAGGTGAFLLSLFIKHICVLLENLLLFVPLLNGFGSAQGGRQRQAVEVLQMTLLGIIEIALLALQDPRRRPHQLRLGGGRSQQQPLSASGGEHGFTDGYYVARSCSLMPEILCNFLERLSNRCGDWVGVRSESGIGRKVEDESTDNTKDDFEKHTDQMKEDVKSLVLHDILLLKDEVQRQQNKLKGKKRQLLKAVTRRHRLLNSAMRSKSLTTEYHKRRRLLSLLEVQIRRLALLRGNRKRCPCLYHSALARPDNSITVDAKGRFRKRMTSSTVRVSGLDTQPVGHANQLFHSTLRKPQKPFRSLYDQNSSRGASVSPHQGASCANEGVHRNSASSPALTRDRKSFSRSSLPPRSDSLSSICPSLPRSSRRVSVSLEESTAVSRHSSGYGLPKKSERVSDVQEDGKELQSLMCEVDEVVGKYMERSSEDGLPTDFRLYYDLKHVGGHSVMPPLNAAAEKENGWKYKRMFFFIEGLINIVANGDACEEKAASFVEPVVALIEQTKVEQCDLKIHSFAERLRRLVLLSHSARGLEGAQAELRNLIPAAYRACLAHKAVTESSPVELGHAEEEIGINTKTGGRSRASTCEISPASVTSPADVLEDPTTCTVSHSRALSVDGSLLAEDRERKEHDNVRGKSASRPHPASLSVSTSAAEGGPDGQLQSSTAVLPTSAMPVAQVQVAGTDPRPTGKNDAEKCNTSAALFAESNQKEYATANNVCPPRTGRRLNISWLKDISTGIDRGRREKHCGTVPALLLLPVTASEQQRAMLNEKFKSVSRVGLASVVEDGGAAECPPEGGSTGSSAAVQWITCFVGLLNDPGYDGSAEVVLPKSDSVTNVASLTANPPDRRAEGDLGACRIQLCATECVGRGLDVYETDSNGRKRISEDVMESINLRRTWSSASGSRLASSLIGAGAKAGSLRERFSLLGRSSQTRGVSNDSDSSAKLRTPCKASQSENGSAVRLVDSLSWRPEHTLTSRDRQEPNGTYTCSTSSGDYGAASVSGCGGDCSSLTGHCDVTESTEAPRGFRPEGAIDPDTHSLSISVQTGAETRAQAHSECKDPEDIIDANNLLTNLPWRTGETGESEAVQNSVESLSPSGAPALSPEAVKDDQNVVKLCHVTGSSAGTECVKRDRNCELSDDNNSVCKKREGQLCVSLKAWNDDGAAPKATQHTASIFGEISSDTLQNGGRQKGASPVVARKKKGKKKLPPNRRKAGTKRVSHVSSTNDTGTDHREGSRRTKRTLQRNSSSTSSEQVQTYPAGAKSSSLYVQRGASGRGKGMLAENKAVKKSAVG